VNIRQYLSSSLGKKQLISLTGLGLILGFLTPHLMGNLFLLKGPAFFNGYSDHLHSLGLILVGIECLFLLLFIVHIILSILVVIENRIARGKPYQRPLVAEKRSIAARTMPYTGTLIFLFLIIHLFDFKFAKHSPPTSVINGHDLGLYGVVINAFNSPLRLLSYGLIMIMVGIHLSHAIQSVFQTFGLKNERIAFWVNLLSYAVGTLLSIGFISILVFVCLQY